MAQIRNRPGFQTTPIDERDSDATRKRNKRAEATRIFIPPCVNPQRRERCLVDPQLLLKTYFAKDYTRPFGKIHNALIDAIWTTAQYGGKLALAAPRGVGKTQVIKGAICAVVLAGFVHFPLPIGPTTDHARELYEDFRRKLMFNDLLLEDFPEICAPIRALEGAPQRAAKQHIDDQLTRIVWTADMLRLPDVPEQYRGPIDYGGVRMEYRGLDAAIRGINRDGDRPDFVPIDEPETRESAKSDSQILDRENAIEKDIAGLAGEGKVLAQVLITTVQNRKCASFRYTEPTIKPSWMGRRYGLVEKWPVEWQKEDGLWHEYIAIRAQDQQAGDRYGRSATAFYLANREAMEIGGQLLSENYEPVELEDGWITVHSPWQVVFDAIADTSFEAFCTEYQNEPPAVEQIQTIDLTHAHVASCKSGYARKQIPDWSKIITRGVDMGKTTCTFVDVSFDMDGTAAVVDYGQFNTFGLAANSSDEAIELAMLNALVSFGIDRDDYQVDMAFVDSGYKPEAVYEGCRRLGAKVWKPIKGPDRYREPKQTTECQVFYQCHSNRVRDTNGNTVFLFHPNTEFWKNWAQERWMQDPYVGGQLTRGSMTLFTPENDDIKVHQTFARSMVSERLEHIPIPGGGYKSVWNVVERNNNHYLDALGYACAAAGCLGVRIVKAIQSSKPSPIQRVRQAQPNNRFRQRPGGWMKGMRNR